MNPQIEIQFTGTYAIGNDIVVVDPLVIATAATDNFVDKVAVSVLFNGANYSVGQNIGSFYYVTTWGNIQVEEYINNFMANCKI